MAFTQRPGAQLYWKRDGRDDAPALVLLNSIGTDMDLWDALLPRLRAHFSLLRIDTRGHGASTAEPGDYAMAMLADDVLAVAGAAGLDRFSIAGVSLGGMIGMEVALRAPGRIERLMPICTSATMDAASWNDRIAKVRAEGMAAIADLAMGRFLSDAAEPAMRALRPNLRRLICLSIFSTLATSLMAQTNAERRAAFPLLLGARGIAMASALPRATPG